MRPPKAFIKHLLYWDLELGWHLAHRWQQLCRGVVSSDRNFRQELLRNVADAIEGAGVINLETTKESLTTTCYRFVVGLRQGFVAIMWFRFGNTVGATRLLL